ncbi:leucine-rich repeat-containing protein 40 [Ixodes scapularis]|uniref:leucine-rich repeat-containing protein 40 n=1 Tax=Ixodes scapularis TaxID=6945 RepID=UPI001A9EAC7A|nr:leucine-rich repeat-containing protein 40 [Ixodes scapularis]
MSRIPKPGTRAERRSSPQACFHLQKKESSLSMDLVKLARKSGQLNLTGRGMIEVPEIVWNINNLTEEERQGLSVSLDHCDGDRWWDQADLTKLYLSSNQLTVLSPDIERLQALNILEINDNQLCGLPETMGKLGQLSKLNISRNKIESLPESFFELKELRQLIGHHNSISELSDDISNLSLMEMMDLSHNRLLSLPATIGFLSRLTNLNLSHNNLTELPPEMGSMNALQVLDVSVNKLRSLPEPVGSLCHLEQLFVQQNELSALPPFSGCGKLKELHAGSNGIRELPIEVIETLLSLRTLDLKNNRLKTLSPDITMIQGLERLDLSNNDLASLPYELGALVHLKGLGVEGNPLRTIRRDIVKRGTVHLLKWLQDHLEHSPEAAARKRLSGGSVTSDGSDLIDSIERFALKTTHALDLSKRSLQDVPEEIFKMASECDVNHIDLSKNSLTSLPKGFEFACPTLTELTAGFNRLTCLPGCLSLASRLTFLDLRNNQLSDLPMEMSVLSNMRELNISFNRFSHLPEVVASWGMLEILFASDNKIELVDTTQLQKLKQIAVLDLRNNSISHVPPELGNMKQLRNLQLEGNPFRNPRPAILSKGTPALLEFLRDRIPR